MVEKKPILSRILIEILGSPQKHVEEASRLVVQKLEKLSHIKVETYKVFDTIKKGVFFTAFIEAEIKTQTAEDLIGFCFDFMPSTVEIIEPDEFQFESRELEKPLNDLLARLHQSDMILKKRTAKKTVLENNLKKLVRNFILHLIKEADPAEGIPISQINQKIGIKEEVVKAYLDNLIKEGRIKEKDGQYSST